MERIQRDISARSSTHISEKRTQEQAHARVFHLVACVCIVVETRRTFIENTSIDIPIPCLWPQNDLHPSPISSANRLRATPLSTNRPREIVSPPVARSPTYHAKTMTKQLPLPCLSFRPFAIYLSPCPPQYRPPPVRLIEHFDFSQTRHRSTLRFIAAIFLLSCRSLPCSYFLLQITYDV